MIPVTYTLHLFTAMDSKMRLLSHRSTLLMTPFPACRSLTMTETVLQLNNRKRKKRKTGLQHSHRLLSRKNINSTIAFVVRSLILLIWRVCWAILVLWFLHWFWNIAGMQVPGGDDGGARHPPILSGQLTLFQPRGADCAHLMILASLDFQTLRRPWHVNMAEFFFFCRF